MAERIRRSLEGVAVPGIGRGIVAMGLVRGIEMDGSGVKVLLASTALIPGAQRWIADRVREAVEQLDGVDRVEVEYRAAKAKELNRIGRIIAVMSGKGGVGKSLVSGLLAVALKRRGYEVGILDADITGPSIPRMFGVCLPPGGDESGILPVMSGSGIEIISINLMLPAEDTAVMWRGPLIANTIKQFGEDVLWGSLDYLIVDLPPGTADVPLTLMQSFPVTGAVVVFTPQGLVEMIVRKAVNMMADMEQRILGVVENMSYIYIPEIDRKIELFGPSRAEEIARGIGVPLLARIPIDPALAALCDGGRIEEYDGELLSLLGDRLIGELSFEA
ncbi:MAG: Mrp/NBP35 family ATP-binding protein [Acidobacteria bacterium]|nr:Mrp/NBP35 family ATP-binding protein [Acidobacteriota bacterium]